MEPKKTMKKSGMQKDWAEEYGFVWMVLQKQTDCLWVLYG